MLSEAVFLEVDAEPRYWEDAKVNGVQEDNDNPSIFGAEGKFWRVKINLEEGSIVDWPQGVTAFVHYKVCDQGLYYLLNKEGRRIAKYNSYYVPDQFLCHGDEGYGDYIILKIDETGRIKDYKKPEILEEDWRELV